MGSLSKSVYDNISAELGFGEILDPRSMIESNNGEYTVKEVLWKVYLVAVICLCRKGKLRYNKLILQQALSNR